MLVTALQTAIFSAFNTLFPNLLTAAEIEVSPTAHPEFGDYQCEIALRTAKRLQQPPRAIGEKLIAELHRQATSPSALQLFAKIELAGPGFINLTLSSQFLTSTLSEWLIDPRFGVPSLNRTKKIIIDFSSPNAAKEMHVGHLRSTIIGDSLAELFEFLGYEVLCLNHIGDWGTAFGMLIAYLKEKKINASEASLSDLVAFYRAAKILFDNDPQFKLTAQQEVVFLQNHDPDSLAYWKKLMEISSTAYQEVYNLLNIRNLVERPESSYNDQLPEIIRELEKKELIVESDGALCVFLDGFTTRDHSPLPFIVKKTDGGYNYATTDLAALKQRLLEEKADRILYVVDAGQSQHFSMLFQTAKQVGWLNPTKTEASHVPFGMVLGSDGKKFKTRSGDVVRLMDLLQEAIQHAHTIVSSRCPELSHDEQIKLSQALGISAVKYADLSSHRQSDYSFSYERMLRFEGNTASFLLYSYVRIQSLFRKTNGLPAKAISEFVHPSERSLALQLLRFPEAIYAMEKELAPNRIADYLYLLAQQFNAFFRDCRVEGTLQQRERLALCAIAKKVFEQGFKFLGMTPVQQM